MLGIASTDEKEIETLPAHDAVSMTSTIREADDIESSVHLPQLQSKEDHNKKQLTGVFSRTISRVRTKDSKVDPGPPPDGGKQAWLMALLTHQVIFNTWGFINSFGIFETYYVNTLHLGNSSQVAWIGSLQVFILFALGTFSGRATDAGFFKLTFITGSVIQLVGIFMTSLCKTYWQVLLAQGVCVGIGNGLVFVPSVALMSTYFLKNRSLALGVAASGSGSGGLVFAAVAQQLLPKVGFAWTVRVMGFVQMVGMITAAILMKPRLPPRKSGPLIEWTAFTELPYLFFCLGAFFLFWGIYIGFYYVGSFAKDILNTSQTTSIDLLLTMNGVGLPARIIPAYFADRIFGPLNSILPFAAIAGIVLYSWIAVDSVTGVWVFAVVYGALAAGCQGLFPAVLTSLTSDPKKIGVRTGMGFGVAGFACLTGGPLAGALIDRDSGSYLYAQVFAASSMLAAFAMLLVCRWTQVGFRLKAKI